MHGMTVSLLTSNTTSVFSFAGEERPYVEMVARVLQDRGARVFYDRDEVKTLMGEGLG